MKLENSYHPLQINLVTLTLMCVFARKTYYHNYQCFNLSVFPQHFKQAHVTPLLKKASLSRQEFKNYRPVSKLNYVSKLMEKVVANQIKRDVDGFGLGNPFQSAYKAFHSTETALLSVTNDILGSMDRGIVTALTLLDLSAAFDTIDHGLLLDRLEEWFGI